MRTDVWCSGASRSSLVHIAAAKAHKLNGVAPIADLREDISRKAVSQLTFNTMLKKRAHSGTTESIARSQFRHNDIRLDPIGLEPWLKKR